MLQETLDLWRRSPFLWGQTDCLMAVANHVRDVTGRDPAAPWRGRYSDRAGAETLMTAHGGGLALAMYAMAVIGMTRAANPRAGDPVVCKIGGHEVAGLWTGDRVAFMAEPRGMIEVRSTILGAWAI